MARGRDVERGSGAREAFDQTFFLHRGGGALAWAGPPDSPLGPAPVTPTCGARSWGSLFPSILAVPLQLAAGSWSFQVSIQSMEGTPEPGPQSTTCPGFQTARDVQVAHCPCMYVGSQLPAGGARVSICGAARLQLPSLAANPWTPVPGAAPTIGSRARRETSLFLICGPKQGPVTALLRTHRLILPLCRVSQWSKSIMARCWATLLSLHVPCMREETQLLLHALTASSCRPCG